MSELDEVREAEEANYQQVREKLGDVLALVEDMAGLYRLLGELLEDVKPRDEIVAGMTFLLGCRYQLTIASLHIARGHLLDSHQATRRAIELAAFAARVKREPAAALLWLKAYESDADWKAYRKQFKPEAIFPDTDPILRRLYERYDQCSKLSHPSVYSLATQVGAERTAEKFSVRMNYFQVRDDDPSEPLLTFLLCLDTHRGILQAFEQVLDEAVALDRARWEVRRNAVEAAWIIQRDRLRAIIDKVKGEARRQVAFYLVNP